MTLPRGTPALASRLTAAAPADRPAHLLETPGNEALSSTPVRHWQAKPRASESRDLVRVSDSAGVK